MNNRMPKILTSPTKNAREVVNPDFLQQKTCSHIHSCSHSQIKSSLVLYTSTIHSFKDKIKVLKDLINLEKN